MGIHEKWVRFQTAEDLIQRSAECDSVVEKERWNKSLPPLKLECAACPFVETKEVLPELVNRWQSLPWAGHLCWLSTLQPFTLPFSPCPASTCNKTLLFYTLEFSTSSGYIINHSSGLLVRFALQAFFSLNFKFCLGYVPFFFFFPFCSMWCFVSQCFFTVP